MNVTVFVSFLQQTELTHRSVHRTVVIHSVIMDFCGFIEKRKPYLYFARRVTVYFKSIVLGISFKEVGIQRSRFLQI